MTTRRQFIEVSAVLGASLAVSPARAFGAPAPQKVSRTRLLLGCAVRATVMGEPRAAEDACDFALDAVARVDDELSLFLPGSALSRLNRELFTDRAPDSLRICLAHALEVAQASRGAFDPTVEPLLQVVARSFRERGGPPSEDELDAARAHVGFARVSLSGSRVRLPPGTALTLNAIAKGYAMDEARNALLTRGASQVLVAASGDMAVGPGRWNLAIQNPLRPQELLERAPFHPSPGGMGASGGYMNSFTLDRSWHHILDPRTGHSPTHFAGVVVSASSAIEADALGTATLVLPEAEALALADARGAALFAVRSDGSEVHSSRAIATGL
jgi:FAD:protein FMN transferase